MAAYYYLDGNTVAGPVSLHECFALLDRGAWHASTLVCTENEEKWRRVDECPELRGFPSRETSVVSSGTGVLTICGGIMLAVLILGLGGILIIQFHDRQERDKARAAAAAAQAAQAVEQARESKQIEMRLALQAQAQQARETRIAAEAQRDENIRVAALNLRTTRARPTPTPRQRRIAPDGTYFLTNYVSIHTSHGITGFEPGHAVRVIKQDAKSGKFRVSEGTTEFDVDPMQVTNDLDVADLVRRQDEQSQLAAQRLQQQEVAEATNARLKLDVAHATVVNALPSGSIVGGHSVLDKPTEDVGGYSGYSDGSYDYPDTSLRSIGGGQ